MKRIILFILCIGMIVMPVFVYGGTEKMNYFSVSLPDKLYTNLGPGDKVVTDIYIKNNSNQDISVRLCEVKNGNHSLLFDVLLTRWKCGSGESYDKFDRLIALKPIEISANQSVRLPLELYFPKELGNKYQGKKLDVEFIFACEGDASDSIWVSTSPAPETGDLNQIVRYVLIITLCSIIVWRKRNESKSITWNE